MRQRSIRSGLRGSRDALAEKVDAVVTAPVNKAAVNLAGIPFTGHTELIAGICGTDDFAMMQSAGNLRVAFVTTHIALKDVPKFATRERIIKTTRLLENAIRAEGITEPKIGIAAINPHAGENGNMGTEDELVTKPAVMHMQEMGMKVEGPFPPDTLFIKSTLDRFDGIISMYHDQGHIPFKMLAFDRGVNSTLGLPVIRTSVDHGTAFEIRRERHRRYRQFRRRVSDRTQTGTRTPGTAVTSANAAELWKTNRKRNSIMFELDIRREFSAAHQLKGYNGDCSNLHGHNWTVEVFIRSEHLDEVGIALDFKVLKKELDVILAGLDHKFLNEHEEFRTKNPTSENIAMYIYKTLSAKINTETVKVSKVRVCESASSGATYFE